MKEKMKTYEMVNVKFKNKQKMGGRIFLSCMIYMQISKFRRNINENSVVDKNKETIISVFFFDDELKKSKK